jgi:hypothetical protein
MSVFMCFYENTGASVALAPGVFAAELLRPDKVEEGVLGARHEGDACWGELMEVLLAQESHCATIEAHKLAAEAAAVCVFVENRLLDAERCVLGRGCEDAPRAITRASGAPRGPILADLHINPPLRRGRGGTAQQRTTISASRKPQELTPSKNRDAKILHVF